jgi:hypothetical protein
MAVLFDTLIRRRDGDRGEHPLTFWFRPAGRCPHGEAMPPWRAERSDGPLSPREKDGSRSRAENTAAVMSSGVSRGSPRERRSTTGTTRSSDLHAPRKVRTLAATRVAVSGGSVCVLTSCPIEGKSIDVVDVWRGSARRARRPRAARGRSLDRLPASWVVRSAPPRAVARWLRADLEPLRSPNGPGP